MELKFAVIFAAVDRMTDIVSHITSSVGEMGNKFEEVGDRISNFGERMALTSALIGEGAQKFHEWSEKLLEPAIGMDEAMTRLSAISGLTGGALDKVRESAIAFSDLHPGVTAEGYVTAFRPLLGVFGDVQKAMQATEAAGKLAQVTGASAADTANLISISFANMGTGPKQFGDMMAAATKKFGLMGEGMSQFTMLYSRMAGLALATNTSAPQMVALVAEASKLSMGRGGARVGSALTEFATAVQQGKVAGFDMGGGLIGILDQIAARTKGLEGPALFRRLVGMGLGSEAVNLVPLLKNLDDLHSKLLSVADSSGSLDRMSKAMEKATGLHLERLTQNLSNLFDAIAKPALPALNVVLDRLSAGFEIVGKFFEAHPNLGGGITAAITAIGLLLTVVATGMAVLGTFLTVIGSSVSALGVAGTVVGALTGPVGWVILGVIALATAIYHWWTPISGFVSRLWGGIKNIFIENSGLLGTIFPLPSLIYQHWAGVKTFFATLWSDVVGIFAAAFGPIISLLKTGWNLIDGLLGGALTRLVDLIRTHVGIIIGIGALILIPVAPILASLIAAQFVIGQLIKHWSAIVTAVENIGPKMYHAGVNLIKTLAEGILSGVKWVTDAASTVAESVMKFFRGHSPPMFGPLRGLGNLMLTETIAHQMDPAPAVLAATRVAAGMMSALMMFPGLMPTAPSGAAVPAAIRGRDLARQGARGSGPAFNVTININAKDGAQGREIADRVIAAFRSHTAEFAQALDRHRSRVARTEYD